MNPLGRSRLLFVLKFVTALAIAIALLSLTLVDDHVVRPFSQVQTKAAGIVLRAARQNVKAAGTLLIQSSYAVDVKNGCNGIEAIALLISALAAFPAPWRARLAAIIAGGVLVVAVNIIRIASLFVILRDYPKAFEFMHVVVWQVALFLLVIGFFVKWSSRYATR
jgi:exosortase H (IPTLxxWG-CTERM-specific)